jgi:hypothetical protein
MKIGKMENTPSNAELCGKILEANTRKGEQTASNMPVASIVVNFGFGRCWAILPFVVGTKYRGKTK